MKYTKRVLFFVIMLPVLLTGCSFFDSPNEAFVEQMDVVADRAIPLIDQMVAWFVANQPDVDLNGDGIPDLDQTRRDVLSLWLKNWRSLVDAAMEE